MLIGSGTGHLLTVTTTNGSSSVECKFDAIVISTATPPVVQGGSFLVAPVSAQPIITAVTVTLVTGAASTVTRVLSGYLFNAHGSVTEVVTVKYTDGTETATLAKATLLAGEKLEYNGFEWLHKDTNGGLYPSVGNSASQAEMEAGTVTDKYVTPGAMNWHPGVCKAWGKHAVSGAVPQMTATWNVTSVSDNGVNRVAPVIATDFSSVNYAISCMAEAATVTYSATTTSLITCVRFATPTVTTFEINVLEIDIGAATDANAWYWTAHGDQ